MANDISNVVGDSYIKLEEVTYSFAELDDLKESALEDLKSSLSDDEYLNSSWDITYI
ncbi:DNA-binding transcriptional regulator YbjK [Virgibacillus halotolerans]|nr:DNA-binding transcriptional regulator YbjK [Virgibacillus halotolerans]